MAEDEILLEHKVENGIDFVRFVTPMVKDGVAVLLMEEELHQILAANRGGPLMVCLDFSLVEFMATTVLVKLISFHKRVKNRKGKLVLFGMQPTVADVFRITSFDKFFTIAPDRESALRKLGQ